MRKNPITYNLPDEWKPAVKDYWAELHSRFTGKTKRYRAQRIIIEMLQDSKDSRDPARFMYYQRFKLQFNLDSGSYDKELIKHSIDLINELIEVTYEKGFIFKKKVVKFKPGIMQEKQEDKKEEKL